MTDLALLRHALAHVLPGLDALDLGHLTQTCRTLRRQPHAQTLYPPVRLVMMPVNLCTLCDHASTRPCHTCMVHYTSGWQACDSCRLTMLYSYFQWMSTTTRLGNAHVPSLRAPLEYTICFYRRSQKRIQRQASMVMTYFDFMRWHRRQVMVMCFWGNYEEGRMVRLSNLIVHNRSLLGYRPPPLDNLPDAARQTWSQRLVSEYQRANEFHHLLLCLHRRRITPSQHVLQHLFGAWQQLFVT